APPSHCLFVVNYDLRQTSTRDLEELFGKYGQLTRCELKQAFAFVEYQDLEDAKDAKEAMDGTAPRLQHHGGVHHDAARPGRAAA
ncbi:unnamed protein product, partial [Heterosigma akashiwo]